MARFRRWLAARQQPPLQVTAGQRWRFRLGRRSLIAGTYFLALFFLASAFLLRDDTPVLLSSSVMAAAWLIAARGFRIQLAAMAHLYERWPIGRAKAALDEFRQENRAAMGSLGWHAIAFFLTAGISFSVLSVGFAGEDDGTSWVAILVPPACGFALAFMLWRRMKQLEPQED